VISALWLACARPIPDHLRLDPIDRTTAPPEITDLTTAVAAVLGRDPLGRSPYLPDSAVLSNVLGAEPLLAYVTRIRDLEAGNVGIGRSLQIVEDDWRGTVAVPLSRGYRLRIAENAIANGALDPRARQLQVVELVTPLAAGLDDPSLARLPMAWLGDDAAIRAYAERWALEGWLAGPGVPVGPVAPLLGAPQYDALRATPMGRLVVARATGADADPAAAWADLERATTLALVSAAADRDAEQAAWSKQKQALTTELGGDPIPTLLKRAAAGLTAAASRDRAAGGALLALAALRWTGACEDAPCAGVDRVETMQAAARWDPDVASLVAAWQVVALKESVDSLEAGRDTAVFGRAVVDLADALLGTDAGAIEAPTLRKTRPDAQVWLTISRAVDEEGATDWAGTRVALGRHLQAEAGRAMGIAPNAEVREVLQRISRRAVP
jgi:hypothetical protein